MKKAPNTVKAITGSAFLIALSVVLTRFLSPYLSLFGSNTMRIGLGTIPIMIGSVMYGPLFGGIIGGASDLVGALMFPSGAYNPGFTVSSILQGVFPYFIIKLFSSRYKSRTVLTSALLCSLIFSTIIYLIGSDTLKISSNLIINFSSVGKIVFIGCLTLFYSAVIVIFYFISKNQRQGNSKSKVRLEDIFLFCLFNETIINVFLSSIWKKYYFNLSYIAMTFPSSIWLVIDVPIKAMLIFILLKPLGHVYPTFAVSSRSIVMTKAQIQKQADLLSQDN